MTKGGVTLANESVSDNPALRQRISMGWLWATRIAVGISLVSASGIVYARFGPYLALLTAIPFVTSIVRLRKNPPLRGGLELAVGAALVGIAVPAIYIWDDWVSFGFSLPAGGEYFDPRAWAEGEALLALPHLVTAVVALITHLKTPAWLRRTWNFAAGCAIATAACAAAWAFLQGFGR